MNKQLFDVIVVATMSAGKSTVINALIGKELLHSANEATTATITRIHDKDELPFFSGNAYSYSNECLEESHNIDANTLKRWNADPNVKLIDLIGNIQALQNDKAELVIYDTPGPNNSQDDNHEALTIEVINDGNFGLILYVLNATQIGTNDDRSLLEKIYRTLSKDKKKKIIFLLNKADFLDIDRGEKLSPIIDNVTNYLEGIGFNQPIIIPTAANYALIANKVINNEKLTRVQRNELENSKFLNKNMIIAAKTPIEIKNHILNEIKKSHSKQRIKISENKYITKQRLIRLNLKSGFGLVSYLLQKYLNQK